MSKITSPILLDSTGQEINETLKGIRDALTARSLIDDNIVSLKKTWSSQKILDALTKETSVEGINSVSFNSIEAAPIEIMTVISKAPITVKATLTSGDTLLQETSYLIPMNGTYYWDTGLFILEDGTSTTLASHYFVAAQGENTLTMTDVDSIKVTYKTKQSGDITDYKIISGGSAKEEA